MTLSVAIITLNEERNLPRTLASVRDIADEIVVVDAASTDRTVELAREMGAKVFVEEWRGYAAQKNSAIGKCTGDWVLSLDADEELSPGAQQAIARMVGPDSAACQPYDGLWLPRKNYFLGRNMRAFAERKLRLFRRGRGRVKDVPVHEVIEVAGKTARIENHYRGMGEICIVHHAYPTLEQYLEHMNRYSSLGAEIAVAHRPRGFSLINIVVRPVLTFVQKYVLKLGFLDGREGLLLCLYHSVYVSWKYAKAWERSARSGES